MPLAKRLFKLAVEADPNNARNLGDYAAFLFFTARRK
jgi:hypothetical protein